MGFNIPKIVISSILVTRIYISHSLTAREFACWRQNKCKEGAFFVAVEETLSSQKNILSQIFEAIQSAAL